MELEGRTTLHNFSASSSLLPTLPNTSITFLKNKKKFQGLVTSDTKVMFFPQALYPFIHARNLTFVSSRRQNFDNGNKKIKGFENDFIRAIGLGGEKCCIIGTKVVECPFMWEL